MRSTFLVALVALTTVSTVACSQSSDEAAPDVAASGATVTVGHAAAVATCDAQHTSNSDSADSTMAMIQAEAQWDDCLARANDGAVAALETNLADVDSYLKGQVAISIAAARSQAEAFCAELDKASSNFGGSLSRVEAVSCRATREKAIASFIDAYAYFGVEPQTIPERRDQHAACYATFDKASETAVATTEMMQVAFDLGDCIGKSADGLAEPLASIAVENDSSVGPLATATARAKKNISDTISSGANLCAVLNEAGDSGGGSLARVTTAHCQVHWAESVYADLATQIGE